MTALPDPEGLSPAQLRSHRLALRLLLPLALLLAVIFVPLYVLYDVAKVDGPSMRPTLSNGEYLLITRGWSDPRHGDVVVIHWTHDGITEELVKRVVGLPGDALEVLGDQVLVNGAAESFPHKVFARADRPWLKVTVPSGDVYLLGDNRSDSYDSRFMGPLPISAIHGRVVAVWAPIDRIRVVPSP